MRINGHKEAFVNKTITIRIEHGEPKSPKNQNPIDGGIWGGHVGIQLEEKNLTNKDPLVWNFIPNKYNPQSSSFER